MSAGPYSIGSSRWAGLSKLIEEAGEVLQIVGKLIATGGEVAHWDGSNLRDRFIEELADLQAACAFVAEVNGLDSEQLRERTRKKLEQFRTWHAAQARES